MARGRRVPHQHPQAPLRYASRHLQGRPRIQALRRVVRYQPKPHIDRSSQAAKKGQRKCRTLIPIHVNVGTSSYNRFNNMREGRSSAKPIVPARYAHLSVPRARAKAWPSPLYQFSWQARQDYRLLCAPSRTQAYPRRRRRMAELAGLSARTRGHQQAKYARPCPTGAFLTSSTTNGLTPVLKQMNALTLNGLLQQPLASTRPDRCKRLRKKG